MKKQEDEKLNALIVLCIKIDGHYATTQKTLVIYLTPREIWEIRQYIEVFHYLFNVFTQMEQGTITEYWYHGAKLIRKEL